MLSDDFNQALDLWITALDNYNITELTKKPSINNWSIGQVYMHLIENTTYYIEQIKICLSNSDNEFREASPVANAIFFSNDLPDTLIEGPPSNNNTPQPKCKEDLLNSLYYLRNEMNSLYPLISQSRFTGKTKHPGLLYFNAAEWFQFAEMHLRHHLRQKKRLDEFLKTSQ
jgi:hypothetical protein